MEILLWRSWKGSTATQDVADQKEEPVRLVGHVNIGQEWLRGGAVQPLTHHPHGYVYRFLGNRRRPCQNLFNVESRYFIKLGARQQFVSHVGPPDDMDVGLVISFAMQNGAISDSKAGSGRV